MTSQAEEALAVYRLEFQQPDGRWTGPYCAEYMTPAAFEIRDQMIAEHVEGDLDRPWPDPEIFRASPGRDRYVCGSPSLTGLKRWFGDCLGPLLAEGGHLGVYQVPLPAIAVLDDLQVVYMQRQGALLERLGVPVAQERLVRRIHASAR